jgi:S1-C subfamily serine protease
MRVRLMIVAMALMAMIAHKPYMQYKYAHKWGKSVVRLLGNGDGGTGFQVKYRGETFILTNDHVCALSNNEDKLIVDSPWGQIRRSKVLARSDRTDLCVLEAHPQLPALTLGDTSFTPFDELTVLGHPLLDKLTPTFGMAKLFQTIDVMLYVIDTPESEAACHKPKNRIESFFFDMFKMCTMHIFSQATTAHIEPGNSGSPVLDSKGLVRGVAFATGKGNLAFIIPLQSILEFLNHAHKHFDMPQMRKHT